MIYTDGGGIMITKIKDDSNSRAFWIPDQDQQSLKNGLFLIENINGTETYYPLFGGHNKPIGTYVGNGSTETRTINIGGMGSTLRIVGYACFGFCTSNGSLFMNSAGELVTTKHVKYESGILTMDTDYHYVNNNDTTYYYEVL